LENTVRIYIAHTDSDSGYAHELSYSLGQINQKNLWQISGTSRSINIKNPTGSSAELMDDHDIFLVLINKKSTVRFQAEVNIIKEVVARHERRKRIVPILIEQAGSTSLNLSNFLCLPKDGVAISQAPVASTLFLNLAKEVEMVVDLFRSLKASDAIAHEMEVRSGELVLFDCQLSFVPIDLLRMPWLTKLVLVENGISKIENLDKLKLLESLNLSSNFIKRIEKLSSLSRLKELRLSHNYIYVLENLASLKVLEVLEVDFNRLLSVSGLTNKPKLFSVSFRDNSIEYVSFPESMKDLTYVFLRNNKIKDLSGIGYLPSLRYLDLRLNEIESIKPLLSYLDNNFDVDIDEQENDGGGVKLAGNPISEPPIEVIEQGWEAILKYFREIKQYGSSELVVLKLILVGNSRVGKSNFSEFIRTGKISENSSSTELLDVKNWSGFFSDKAKDLVVNIFDFGGQDYYHDAHRMFYSQDTAYVLLWERETNKFSERVDESSGLVFEDFPLDYWLESINYNLLNQAGVLETQEQKHKLVEKMPVWLIQNKIDLLKKEGDEVDSGFLNQVDLIRRFPNIWDFTSVALERGKRTKVLPEILDDFMDQMLFVGRKLVKYELKIVNYFLDFKQHFDVLSLERFKDLCIELIDDDRISFSIKEAEIQAQILNNMGLILYDKQLEEPSVFTNILNLNEYIKVILSSARENAVKGVFNIDGLKAHIPYRTEIIALLCRNSSIIDLGSGNFLAPQFLSKETDGKFQFFSRAFKFVQVRFVYKADFHKSLLMNIFSKYLSRKKDAGFGVKEVPYWRNGIIISGEGAFQDSMVLLEFIKNDKEGVINVRTMSEFDKSGFEGEVVSDLEALNFGWTVEKQLSVNSLDFVDAMILKSGLKAHQYVFHLNQLTYSISAFKNLDNFVDLPKKIFVSYSSKNGAFAKRLMLHLEVLKNAHLIEPWYDRMIETGSKWNEEIQQELTNSDVVILLMSPEFLASTYVMNFEVPFALKLLSEGKIKIFPIEIQACGWSDTPLNEIQLVLEGDNEDKKQVIVEHPQNDAVWSSLIVGLKKLL